MDKKIIPADVLTFADELKELCVRYKITELVALGEYDARFTTVLQCSATGGRHTSFNNLKAALEKMMNELQDQKAKSN